MGKEEGLSTQIDTAEDWIYFANRDKILDHLEHIHEVTIDLLRPLPKFVLSLWEKRGVVVLPEGVATLRFKRDPEMVYDYPLRWYQPLKSQNTEGEQFNDENNHENSK